MAAAAVIFVSKRLQRAAFAMLCLIAAQLALSLASREPEQMAVGAVRVAIPQP